MPFDHAFTDKLKDIIQKLRQRDPKKIEIIYKKVKQIVESDEMSIERFKNLRHNLSDRKRVHIDKSFVLTFKFDRAKNFILFLDFDHHDVIYEKK